MRRPHDPVLAAIGAVVLSASLAACGGSTNAYSGAPAPAAVEFPAAPGEPAPDAVKMSANSASEAELVTALRAAGVSNPERWAEEIIEYRPYASNDVELTKLVQNLTKYNPGPQTLEKILSVLQP